MKIAIITLGCKVNQYESDAIAELLTNQGHTVVQAIDFADQYILNTCAVTNEAEKKSRQMFAKINKINPNAKVIVCGCASQKNYEQFKNFKNVSLILGVANKEMIATNINKCDVSVDKLPDKYDESLVSHNSYQTRAYVKIQDGCNNFCSYCIIPFLRGRSRSRSIIHIINEVAEKAKQAQEIVLTGIDISDYKIDGELALVSLLQQLDNFNVRLRLGSLEVRVITEEFVKSISHLKNLCPHFHLSLQSGSDGVLKRMNRHYTSRQYLSAVKLIRRYFKNPAITTDIIVGFPEETQDEFNETYEFVKKVNFSQLHIFPYSKREGTRAAKMKQVDGNIKNERVKKLEELKIKLNKKYFKKCKKQKLNLLIEEKIDNYYVGHTENYMKAYIEGDFEINSIIKIKLIKIFNDGFLAIKGE